jgi:enamine deaminase RidA (YjgF/YER057c/UK114 family)
MYYPVAGAYFSVGDPLPPTATASSAAPLPSCIVGQIHAVMENLRTVLAGLSLGFEHVVIARVYLTRSRTIMRR